MRWVGALVAAGFVASLAATPALADHDHHDRGRDHYRHREYHGDWHHSRHYYRDYDRGYYYEPRVEYYAAPRIYVPPPPSFGLNLVFPIH